MKCFAFAFALVLSLLSAQGASFPSIRVTGATTTDSLAATNSVTTAKVVLTDANNGIDVNGLSWIRGYFGNGTILIQDTSKTTFDRLQIGGISSGFPAIKRVGAGLYIWLADDSGFAPLAASTVTATNFLTIPLAVSYSSSVTVDFAGAGDLTTILAGDETISASNQSNGKGITYTFFNGAATNCNVILPSTWRIQSGAVTNILAPAKSATLSMKYFSFITNTVALWVSE